MSETEDTSKKKDRQYPTTMRNAGSTLALIGIEQQIQEGGTLEFPSGMKVTREDLEGPARADNDTETK